MIINFVVFLILLIQFSSYGAGVRKLKLEFERFQIKIIHVGESVALMFVLFVG